MANANARAAESSSGKKVALSVNRLSKRFPGVQALTDVSLDLCVGEVLGLVGENGAGKSTLIKIIAGVESADSGVITLANSTSPNSSAGIAVIYQELTIVPAMSALSNVFLGDIGDGEVGQFRFCKHDNSPQRQTALGRLLL